MNTKKLLAARAYFVAYTPVGGSGERHLRAIVDAADEIERLWQKLDAMQVVYEAANALRPIGSPASILRMQALEDALRKVREAS